MSNETGSPSPLGLSGPTGSTVDQVVTIQPSRGLFRLDLASVWNYRELLYFLVWRDVKVRYKQTLIGAGWAVLQPLMTMAIFTVVFGNFAKIPSDGVPYPVFAYTALLPWTYFAHAVGASGTSLVGRSNLINKIYFPRLIILLASVTTPLVDFLISLVVLAAMMVWFRISPGWSMLALPLFLMLAMSTALAVGLWLSPLNVRFRDVGHTIPFLLQFWMYASPVAYPMSIVPQRWQLLYSLNPMAGVIEGFRWALLGRHRPSLSALITSAVIVLVLLATGLIYFKRMERDFADVI
ncbi:MAG TPA: ABC transporter permease [Pyrinomonadaceae bacterium]|nr:ABC transporter permease [Pyrinomonadaceae bacterium]